jgi:glutathione peroxidase
VLVVNTASKCGFTPQFEALEALHKKYSDRGFAVLGFPSGDFKSQEYDDEKQIREFCTLTYGVKFPMFEKVHVVGNDATPLYKDLAQASGQAPRWNFHKYLLGRDGRLIASWGSKTTPDDKAVVEAIERALQAPRPAKTGA